MELLLRDSEVAELYVAGRLERKSSYSLFVGVMNQLAGLVGMDAIPRFYLPKDVLVEPMRHWQSRQWDPSTEQFFLTDEREGTQVPIMPEHFDLRELYFCHHTVDRGSTGCAALHFVLGEARALMGVQWGVFHDGWNATKHAAKKSQGGEPWRHVVRFAGVANFPFGPFRSGKWGIEKQGALTELVQTTDCHHPRFQSAVELQAALAPDPKLSPGGVHDLDAWWKRFSELPSCTHSGPCVKFSRWASIQDAWRFYRLEWHLLGYVLEHLASVAPAEETAEARTGHWELEVEEKSGQKKGLKQRVPKYVTVEVAESLDCFVLVNSAFLARYQHRASRITTIAKSLEDAMSNASGRWTDVYIQQVNELFWTPTAVGVVLHEGMTDERRVHMAKGMVDQGLHVLSENLIRDLPRYQALPGISVLLLHEDAEVRKYWLNAYLTQWVILEEWEREASLGLMDVELVLSDLHWRKQTLPRLLHLLVARDKLRENDVGADARYVLEACHVHLADEKGPEDLPGRVSTCPGRFDPGHVDSTRMSTRPAC